MDGKEIFWRVQSVLRDAIDYWRFHQGRYPQLPYGIDKEKITAFSPRMRLSGHEGGPWGPDENNGMERIWVEQLTRQADAVVNHKFSYFDLLEHDHGDPIDWNYDHSSHKRTKMEFANRVDYRDFDANGDCKLVWEPNRHHQLVVLGRAFRATGKRKYALAVIEQLLSWIDQNPVGVGMNWKSPMELSIRLINWVWAYDLIYESGLFKGEAGYILQKYILYHLNEVTRKYSKGSSANNHLIGEAAGVYIATSYFHTLPNADEWKFQSKQILIDEIINQTYADGCGREHAFGYQFFILQFFLLSGMVGKKCNDDFPPAYWDRIETMMEFLHLLSQGGRIPNIGDSDDGYVLDLGNQPQDIQSLLCIGAIIFEHKGFKSAAGGFKEVGFWLFGEKGRQQFDGLHQDNVESPLRSRAFPESGYYLLQCGGRNPDDDTVSLFMDCAELGYGPIAAHGHADALSVVVRVNGIDILTDPGTYDYFTYPEWREYFRSTRAHNTVQVDGVDQSEMGGAFIWGKKANARCLKWDPTENGAVITGEHDGYARLEDPVVHRRTVELDGNNGSIRIKDQMIASLRHSISIQFHFGVTCRLSKTASNCWRVDYPGGRLQFRMDERLSVKEYFGSQNPIAGWYSNGYHRKHPVAALYGEATLSGPSEFQHVMKLL